MPGLKAAKQQAPRAPKTQAPEIADGDTNEFTKEDRAQRARTSHPGTGSRAPGRGRGAQNGRSNRGTYLGGARPRRDNGGGRPFDRHSQTGKTESQKQVHQALGDDADRELDAEVQGEADANQEARPETPAAVDGTVSQVDTSAPPAEEEDKSMTLDEYLKSQAERKLDLGVPQGRQANEGQDDSLWKDGVAVSGKGSNENEWYFGKEVRAQVRFTVNQR